MTPSPSTTFYTKNHSLVREAITILERERPMTLRALYYRLVSSGQLLLTNSEYKRLGKVMVRLREGGDVPITGWLVDRVRSTLKPSSWSGLADFGDTVRMAYRKDFWARMPHHVVLFVEKDAIAGTIQPVTEEFDIGMNVIRGDVSVSFAGEIGEQWNLIKKPIYVYYLGDFDPAGFDIERVLKEKLSRYSKIPILDDSDRYVQTPGQWRPLIESEPGIITWVRLGVIAKDFLDEESGGFNLLALPVKETKRTPKFIREHGNECAEVDAIAPSELRRRVMAAIECHIDQDRWQKLRHIEELEKKTLLNLLGEWNGKENQGSLSGKPIGPKRRSAKK